MKLIERCSFFERSYQIKTISDFAAGLDVEGISDMSMDIPVVKLRQKILFSQ